jgi:NAD(P)-dependent dehydrogenase (short-subunit alcohol dehydrogenase family)
MRNCFALAISDWQLTHIVDRPTIFGWNANHRYGSSELGVATPCAVLITGATSGLGRAAAILLAEWGYEVFAAGRSSERRAELDALARERRLSLRTVELDVRDDGSVDRAMAQVEAAGGSIEVLVNNAGLAYVAPMEEIRLEDLHQQFETNFFGVVRMTQRVLPRMRERRRGRIINMSSMGGRLALPLFGPYSGSKFALEGMSDALRLELYPFGIDVVLIEPGYIPTGMEQTSTALSGGYRNGMERGPYAGIYKNFVRAWRRNASRAKTTPEDCARVILRAVRDAPPRTRYLVTPGSEFILWGKRLLPERFRDRLMRRSFGLKRESPERS